MKGVSRRKKIISARKGTKHLRETNLKRERYYGRNGKGKRMQREAAGGERERERGGRMWETE